MTFDLATVTAIVKEIAAQLIPGWQVTCELAPSVEANQNALAMVWPTPERQLAHVVVAPHPPHESLRESLAHELTHALLAPLTKLIEWSPAAVMIEEQIVERLGKIIAGAPTGTARAMMRALQHPRTNSPTIRKRISALAVGRRNETRKRMEPKALAALAMEGGALTAAENPDPAAMADFIKRVVEALASGGDAGPGSAPMREDKPEDGKGAPPMREEEVPEAMRAQYRTMQRTTSMSLGSAVRLRIHELRTVDKLDITPAIEAMLRKAKTVEDFEEKLDLVKASLGASTEQRKRSGTEPDGNGGRNGSPSIESLRRDYPTQIADDIHRNYEKGAEFGDVALKAASKFRKAAPNG
jgi:hypothetical protein